MRSTQRFSLLAVLILTAFQGVAQTPIAYFEQGNKHYTAGQYQEAVNAYEKILDSDQISAAVYYNLANAHYKLNNTAPSIFYFEKAKQLAPGDKDIRNNAAFAENMKIDAITPLPENIFKKTYSNVLNVLTVDGWAYAIVIFVFLCVASFLGYYFSTSTSKKRLFFVTTIVSFILAGLSLALACRAFAKAKQDKPAIIFAVEAKVMSEPTAGSAEAFKLHEGTKVFILEAVDQWKKIRLTDGKTGWIQSTDLRAL